MGSFSWTRAEHTTQRANLTDGDRYKILVPQEFGGGFILDTYYDYGYVFEYENGIYIDGNGDVHPASEFPKSDLYGILAYWNQCDGMEFDGEDRPQTMISILKRGDTADRENRYKGIVIGCYDDDIDTLQYPLKLVSSSYDGTYEDCAGVSYGDLNQGFHKGWWKDDDYTYILDRLQKRENAKGDCK